MLKKIFTKMLNEVFISVRQVLSSSRDEYNMSSDIAPVHAKVLQDNSQCISHNFLTNARNSFCIFGVHTYKQRVSHLQYLVFSIFMVVLK